MAKIKNEKPVENETDEVGSVVEKHYSIDQLRNSLNVLECSAVVFEGAVTYASKLNLISSSGVTISQMKEIINKWLILPIK